MDCLAPRTTADAHTATATETRILSFSAGGSDFAIDIRRVREIRMAEPATRLPGAPDALRGVIDLRGSVVPVIDLARHIGAAAAAGVATAGSAAAVAATPGAATAVIVVEIGERLVGLQVDAVDDVITLAATAVRSVPPLANTPLTAHLLALAAVGDRLLQWLDVSSLLRDVSTAAHASR